MEQRRYAALSTATSAHLRGTRSTSSGQVHAMMRSTDQAPLQVGTGKAGGDAE